MSDYADICIALKTTIRDTYDLANEGKMKDALKEAQFLSALADQLVVALKEQQ